jgi:hypothetical protein
MDKLKVVLSGTIDVLNGQMMTTRHHERTPWNVLDKIIIQTIKLPQILLSRKSGAAR